MKTTFKEVFNNLEDDLINIDENSVFEDMNIDIDIDKIKAKVFERLNTNMDNDNVNRKSSVSKKRYTKKFRITLIAAVIVVSMILGTTAIYATGTFQSIFGGFFGGNLNSAGLHNGNNVTFESPDPNINAQLLGITGDERQVYAMIEVSHKDETPITDEGYIHPFWWSDDSENASYEDYYKNLSCDAYFVDKNGELVGHVVPCFDMADDAKTLKILIKMPIGGKDISDYTLVVENRAIGANKVLEVVATKETLGSEYEYLDKEIESNIKTGKESDYTYAQIFNGEYYEYCKVDRKKFDCPFTMSFEININDTGYINKKLTTKNAPNLVLPETDEVNMEITPFAINITAKADMQVYKDKGASIDCKYIDFICCEKIDYYNSKVILNDGTEYFLYYYPSGGNNITKDENGNEYYEEVVVLNFSKVIAPLEAEVNLIDTREIKAVIINGDTVYGRK